MVGGIMEKNEKKRDRQEEGVKESEVLENNSTAEETAGNGTVKTEEKRCRNDENAKTGIPIVDSGDGGQTRSTDTDVHVVEKVIENPSGADSVKRYKKRKIALMIAYCGAGYQGMQRNPGAITIEGELEEALFKAGAFQDSLVGQPKKLGWMRAARTDKGVSALGQVVSGNFCIDPPGLVERVNSHLPGQIRLLGYKRVTPSFDAKQMCVRRRYEYVLPVHVFDPELDVSSRLSTMNVGAFFTEREANKPVSSGRNNEDIPVVHKELAVESHVETVDTSVVNFSVLDVVQQTSSVPLFEQSFDEVASVKTVPEVDEGIEEVEEDGNRKATWDAAKEHDKDIMIAEIKNYLIEKTESGKKFQFGEAGINRLNRVLGRYVGTHSFHNFTPRTKAGDPSSLRYIISFEAENIFFVNGMEFVRCSVVGQSFMLHQIRRMIGLAVTVLRGCAPESIIEAALRRDSEVKVPMAPELGLFLEECYYSSYNSKFGKLHEEVSLVDYSEDVRKFKHEVIYPHIASTEVRELTFALWVQRMSDEHFPQFAVAREKESLSEAARP